MRTQHVAQHLLATSYIWWWLWAENLRDCFNPGLSLVLTRLAYGSHCTFFPADDLLLPLLLRDKALDLHNIAMLELSSLFLLWVCFRQSNSINSNNVILLPCLLWSFPSWDWDRSFDSITLVPGPYVSCLLGDEWVCQRHSLLSSKLFVVW